MGMTSLNSVSRKCAEMLNWKLTSRRVGSLWLRGLGELLLVGLAVYWDLRIMLPSADYLEVEEMPLWVTLTGTAIAYPLLLLRWRYPWLVFMAHWVFSLILTALWEDLLDSSWVVPFVGLLVALYPLARRMPLHISGLAFGACWLSLAVVLYVKSITHERLTDTFLLNSDHWAEFEWLMITSIMMLLIVWGLGCLPYTAEQRAEHERLEQTAAAVREERLYLARELHDVVSHSVSAMILQAAGARTLVSLDDEQVRVALGAIETTGVGAMGELHRLLGLLRAASSVENRDELAHPPSLHDLDSLVSSARATGVDVEVVVEGHPVELDRSVGLTAYRIVQEALTNTIKHAGSGASTRIHLRWETGGLMITIRDRAGLRSRDTAGLSSGHGLVGLNERVELVGGSLETGPTPDGFLVRAHLPTSPPGGHHLSPGISHEDVP